MADTLTVTSPDAVTLEWLTTPIGQRDPVFDLVDAVVIAVGTDRLALPDDELPDSRDTNRRGWWGDLEAKEIWDGWPVGTRFWLLERSSITGPEARRGSTVARAEHYIREALEPFRKQRIVSRIVVTAERVGTERIDVRATLYRGPESAIELRFADLWRNVIA